jgi:hypothetical protein
MKSLYRLLFTGLVSLCAIQCKKLVQVDSPVTSVTGANVFSSESTAISALTGVYASMGATILDGSGSTGPGGGIPSISFYAGLSSDELSTLAGQTNTTYARYYQNTLSVNPPLANDLWTKFYPVVYFANTAIAGLDSVAVLNTTVKKQLWGEAKFIRAFCYFYLINLYGDAPLVLGTNYSVNAYTVRTPKAQIYQQIVADLKDAQAAMSPTFLDGTLLNTSTDRVRPTMWAATALLARVYLYMGDWVDAEAQATTVISNASLFGLSSLANAFLKASSGNKEAIWQLQPVVTGWNTPDARMFVLPSTGPTSSTSTYPVFLNKSLFSAFEPNDLRKTTWTSSVTVTGIAYPFAYKYKSATLNASVTEYEMVLRLAEQYLIRAEARARQNNIAGAQGDLNLVRTRANLPGTLAGDQATLLTAILHERRVELFTEWGHRWMDLKRTGTVDSVMNVVTPIKVVGGQWSTNQQLYPIPSLELQRNPALTQNMGY